MARNPEATAAVKNGIEGEVNLVGEPDSSSPLRMAVELPSTPSTAATHARALFIYLRHHGALNVEEFRRTNARIR